MSVVSFKEIHRGRGGSEALQGKWKTIVEHSRVFRAKTNSNLDDETTILTYVDCPVIGDQHPTDPDCYCVTRDARNEDDSKIVWIVTCQYSDDREVTINPALEPAEITWSTQSKTRLVAWDKNGYGIVNSAGYPYDPLPEVDDSRWCCNIVKNVVSIPTWILTYRDAVNSDAVVIDGIAIAAGYAKMMDLSISKWEKRDIFRYRTLSFSIAVDAAGWGLKVLDSGMYEHDGKPCVDANFMPVTDAVCLDGTGHQLASPTTTNVVFRTHNVYNALPFSILPLS